MATTIVQDGDPLLRAVAKPVPEDMIGGAKLTAIIKDLADTLDGQEDGVAIAAPQIGLPWRIFVVRHDRVELVPEGAPIPPPEIGVFINPEIAKTSKRRELMEEGCLSVRGKYGSVERHVRTTVKARREDGARFERGGGGLLAQVFQHEIDHLNGILFTDKATSVRASRKKADAGDTESTATDAHHAHED